jgi:hypothetical protein
LLKTAKQYNLDKIGNASQFITSNINSYVCEPQAPVQAPDAIGAYSGGPGNCPRTMYLYPKFFGMAANDPTAPIGTLIHETTHYKNCPSNMARCEDEQLAFNAKADLFKLLGDTAEENHFRCNWWPPYTTAASGGQYNCNRLSPGHYTWNRPGPPTCQP